METKMPKGTVKWFNPTKGYGFIQPSGGGGDVFVHISAVERAGLRSLNEGQTIEYDIESNRGRQSAANLRVKWRHITLSIRVRLSKARPYSHLFVFGVGSPTELGIAQRYALKVGPCVGGIPGRQPS